MTAQRIIAAVAVIAMVGVATPAAAHDETPHRPTGLAPATSANLRLVGHVNPGPVANADVYGYRGHAYLASFVGNNCNSSGIRVYSLWNPARPKHVATFADKASEPDLAGTWTEKVIVQRVDTARFHGVLAVVTFQTCDSTDDTTFRGFGLYDVTNPAKPKALSRYAAPGTRGSHEIWLGADAGHAYVYAAVLRSEWTSSPTYDRATNTATTPGRADFRIVDVADPRHPVDAGEWGAWKELGVVPVANPAHPYEGFQSFTHSVRVDTRLRRAYLSNWDLGTVILDVSDARHPRYLGRTTPEQGSTHSAAIDPTGRFLIETHERLGGIPMIYDVSDPARPRELAHLTKDGQEETSVHDPKLRGSLAYFSWYEHGVVVADVSKAWAPRVIGQFLSTDTTPNPDFCDFEGGCVEVWGVFVLGDLILASDMNSGLYVLRLKR
ncbi:hypothetical protein F4553_001381 [Allocatelliglobosispora scoriae]|uniref:LVIVD repeat-containing protein n=1 Tax=Allocatelliglobosispora scoriae TaxID=643052 RepID=A0A841BMM4_9ACTN|nr:hypothetical protein [Allocatelliglobosispora scoriae]MBB5868002.1 hypothetical protein [Allocatelliglobosispora scoriae]